MGDLAADVLVILCASTAVVGLLLLLYAASTEGS